MFVADTLSISQIDLWPEEKGEMRRSAPRKTTSIRKGKKENSAEGTSNRSPA